MYKELFSIVKCCFLFFFYRFFEILRLLRTKRATFTLNDIITWYCSIGIADCFMILFSPTNMTTFKH